MTGEGAAGRSLSPVPTGLLCTMVAARWHAALVDLLIAGAERAIADHGARSQLVRVAGAFELPLLCQAAAARSDLVVALGIVIRGETPHFDYVCQATTSGLLTAGLSSGTPIGFGVLTVDSEAQAVARCGGPGATEDKGYDATCAAFESHAALLGLAGVPGRAAGFTDAGS